MVPNSLEISPKTRLMGLIGESISYSLSPMIHNGSAKKLGIDAAYFCFSLSESRVANFLNSMWDVGALGFNVTQPHKSLVAEFFPETNAMSVNTIYRGPDSWLVDSTDGIGLSNALLRSQVKLLNFERIVIVGSGGAAISIAEFLQKHRFGGEVVFAIRSEIVLEKLNRLKDLRLVLVHQRSETLSSLLAESKNVLLIQATSAPLKSDRMEWLLPYLRRFNGVYLDMTYAAASAPLEYCRQKGLSSFDGKSMLIEQARASQQLWWGKSEDYESIASRLEIRSP